MAIAGLGCRAAAAGLRLPDDLSITGFDDSEIAGPHPVADLARDGAGAGERRPPARSALGSSLRDREAPPTSTCRPPGLVVCHSTAPPRPTH